MNILIERSDVTWLVQSHKGFSPFNYDICVDWAIDLLQKEVVTDNIQMLSAFSKPTDAWEIKPFVSKVLKEFNIEEFEGEKAIQSQSYYYIQKIVNGENDVLGCLEKLARVCVQSEYEKNVYPFYLLYYSWGDLEDFKMSFHYQDVTFSNFNETVLKEAKIWLENFEMLK